MSRVFCQVVLFSLLLVPFGCGPAKPSVYSVSGKVTVDGKPLPDVEIFFIGTGQNSQNYKGKTGADGSYSLSNPDDGRSGAQAGKYKIVLAVTGDAANKAMMNAMMQGGGNPDAGPAQGAQLPFPKEYTSADTSPKEVEVKAQSNTIDITIP